MAQATRMFRIFVSSTFSDLKAERNALQERVWPRLRELCARQGARFQAIDLRWGVSQEASLDQQTMSICLDEIARSQKVSRRPNFLVLLGDRYGSRLLPARIPASEYEAIVAQVTPNDAARLAPWYRRDDNALPQAEYVLQPREAPYDDYTAWSAVERELRAALVAGMRKLPAGSYDPARFLASATEQEILAGALAVADAGEHVHCFFRAITNLDELVRDAPQTDGATDDERRARSFVDLDTSDARDQEAEANLASLKDRLRTHLPAANIHTYDARWTGDGISGDHIQQLCDDVYATLARLIEGELAAHEQVDAADREEEGHRAFGVERRQSFQGRETIRQAITAYVAGGDQHPLVVYGASGAGKSALMALASEEVVADASARRSGTVVVTRYIGATPESADTRALLQGLCRTITRRYGGDETSIPTDYDGLVAEFPKRLALATEDKPLVLFLDALDQLGDGQQVSPLGPNLNWLPSDLPEHVRVVVSILAGAGLEQLRRRLPAGSVIELERMPDADGAVVLDRWLAGARRTLQPGQRAEVLGKFAVHGLPLYLRLAFEEARRWKSYTPTGATALDPEIPGIIRQLFARLAAPANHGAVLVGHGLGDLGAARNGLSEDEVLDVLSADSDVLADFRARSPNSPQADRLPVVIWSRLYFDLEPYLSERSTEGATVLAFYHRQLGEAVDAVYLAGADGLARHRGLARYFAWPEGEVDAEAAPNLRRLAELPYQQTLGEEWDGVFATLTNFSFLEQKAAHLGVLERTDAQGEVAKTYTGVYLLQDDYDLAVARMPAR